MERKEAIDSGLQKYNTGRKCRYGHDSDRYTLSGACCECMDELRKSISTRFSPHNFKKCTEEIYIILDLKYIEDVKAKLSYYCLLIDPRFTFELFRNSVTFKDTLGLNSHRYRMRVPIGQKEIVLKMAADLLDTPERRAEMAAIVENELTIREWNLKTAGLVAPPMHY